MYLSASTNPTNLLLATQLSFHHPLDHNFSLPTKTTDLQVHTC